MKKGTIYYKILQSELIIISGLFLLAGIIMGWIITSSWFEVKQTQEKKEEKIETSCDLTCKKFGMEKTKEIDEGFILHCYCWNIYDRKVKQLF